VSFRASFLFRRCIRLFALAFMVFALAGKIIKSSYHHPTTSIFMFSISCECDKTSRYRYV
jgi:hypothetical protein